MNSVKRTMTILLAALFSLSSVGLQPTKANNTSVTMRTLTSSAGGFSVQMPGEPVYKQKQISTQVGMLALHSWTVEMGNYAYSVMYNDYPNAPTNSKAFFDKVREGAAEGKRLIKEVEIEVAGYPGRGLALESDEHVFFAMDYLVGKRLYQLIFVMPKGSQPPPEVKKFLTSFVLLKA